MMFLWLVIIGVLLYLLLGDNISIKSFSQKKSSDLLEERLARGEISIEEYQKIKAILKEKDEWI